MTDYSCNPRPQLLCHYWFSGVSEAFGELYQHTDNQPQAPQFLFSNYGVQPEYFPGYSDSVMSYFVPFIVFAAVSSDRTYNLYVTYLGHKSK